ncbi:hypothetical protein VP277E431_P0160 [Vibrio phage 277E43-1]|nr:hypothetical protein VP277E431_P0160 [Vibrio phage 277E43-1]
MSWCITELRISGQVIITLKFLTIASSVSSDPIFPLYTTSMI